MKQMARREINKPWIQARLKSLGKSQAELAAFLSISPAAVSLMLKGERAVTMEEGVKLRTFLRCSLVEIYRAFGLPQNEQNYGKLPVLGYIDASSGTITMRVELEAATLEEIDSPFPGYRGCVVKIKGNSMAPRYRDGEAIGYCPNGHDISHLIGLDTVVATEDGRMLLKILQKGTEAHRYTLLSLNRDDEPIINIAISWAAPVDWHLPRKI